MEIKKLKRGFKVEYACDEYAFSDVNGLIQFIQETYDEEKPDVQTFEWGDHVYCDEHPNGGIINANIESEHKEAYPYVVYWSGSGDYDEYTKQGEWVKPDARDMFTDEQLDKYRLKHQ